MTEDLDAAGALLTRPESLRAKIAALPVVRPWGPPLEFDELGFRAQLRLAYWLAGIPDIDASGLPIGTRGRAQAEAATRLGGVPCGMTDDFELIVDLGDHGVAIGLDGTERSLTDWRSVAVIAA